MTETVLEEKNLVDNLHEKCTTSGQVIKPPRRPDLLLCDSLKLIIMRVFAVLFEALLGILHLIFRDKLNVLWSHNLYSNYYLFLNGRYEVLRWGVG